MSEAERDAAAFFDERARSYDEAYDARGADGHALRARMEAALRLAGHGPGEALDAGMGPGRLLAELAAQGWSVSGVDPAEKMVAVARRRLPEAASRLVAAQAEQLPFADASFDLVLTTGVLEFTDLPRALVELARVLRPGGRAVVSYPNGRSLYGAWKTRVFYRGVRIAKQLARRPRQTLPKGSGLVSLARFRALLASAGFVVESVEYTSFLVLPSPLDVLLPGATEALGSRLEGSGPGLGRLLATQLVLAARKP